MIRRLLAWLGMQKPTAPLSPATGRHLSADSIVGWRLRNLADVDWPGRDQIMVLGEEERSLRTAMTALARLEIGDSPLSRKAGEFRSDIEVMLDADSRFAELMRGWPANWSQAARRFDAIATELRERAAVARELLDAAHSAEECGRAYAALKDRHERSQPELWRRITDELDLDAAMARAETPGTVKSIRHRLSLAEDVLEESAILLRQSLDVMVNTIQEAGYGPYVPGGNSLEAEASRLREWIPEQCADRIKTSGHILIDSSTRQLRRLREATASDLRAGLRSSFGMEPLGPIVYWARLHYSTHRSDRPRHIRKTGLR